MTTAGGITAVNHGVITNCVNKGIINPIVNTTDNAPFTLTSDSVTVQDNPAAYSYIRAYNQYSLFATANAWAQIYGGICGINFNTITGCENKAAITGSTVSSYTLDDRNVHLDFIAVTRNGYHQNGIYFGDTTIQPFGFRWWVTEDIVNTDAANYPEGVTTEIFDRNMPYPFVGVRTGSAALKLSAGITGVNVGTIQKCSSASDSDLEICAVSHGLTGKGKASIEDITFSGAGSYYITDTDIDNVEASGMLAERIEAVNFAPEITDCYIDNYVFQGDETKTAKTGALANIIDGTEEYRVTLLDIVTGNCLAANRVTYCDFSDIISKNGVSNMANTTLRDALFYDGTYIGGVVKSCNLSNVVTLSECLTHFIA